MTHDDYDQLAENVQREDLSPWEIAMFIQKRLSQGDKKSDIDLTEARLLEVIVSAFLARTPCP